MISIKRGIAISALSAFILLGHAGMADEGGASFWLPGQFGSFAAVRSEPGWSLATIYYHASADAEKSRSFNKGRFLTAGLEEKQDLLMLAPTYVFSDPLWGGQASVSLTALYGRVSVDVNAKLDGINTSLNENEKDVMTAQGDLYPFASVRWNAGNDNYMLYAMGGIPTGRYDPDRLASVGSNHWSLDLGGAYTYFNPKTGYEFSVTAGATYNWENPDTDYRSGIDGHIDWGASLFLSDTLNVGAVGYVYYQLTGDSGKGATLGDFKSRVYGIGPQLNWFFPVGKSQGLLNLKGYWEFGADHRPEGWNSWLILSIPLGSSAK